LLCTLGQAVAIFEFAVPLCLLLGPAYRLLFVGGLIAMHIAILLLMDGLWLFSIQMIALDLMLIPDKFTVSVVTRMLTARGKVAALFRRRS
jgi:hypothetical protein